MNYRLATKGIGTSVSVGVMRAGEDYAATLALEAAPETVPRDELDIAGYSPFTGAKVLNLSPAVAEELAYPGRPEGVIVRGVAAGSFAAEAGLRPGDVVREVNGVAVASTRQLAEISSGDVRRWQVVIERNGRLIRSQFRG